MKASLAQLAPSVAVLVLVLALVVNVIAIVFLGLLARRMTIVALVNV
jgi:hypothetical protein